jgi:hypothetical protein
MTSQQRALLDRGAQGPLRAAVPPFRPLHNPPVDSGPCASRQSVVKSANIADDQAGYKGNQLVVGPPSTINQP